MGVSTDAILGYGIIWTGDEMGEETWDFLFEDWDRCREVERKFKVDISTHCSDDCKMLYIVDKDLHQTASRGYPVLNPFPDYPPSVQERDERILAALKCLRERAVEKELDLVVDYLDSEHSDPGWFLCSYWG